MLSKKTLKLLCLTSLIAVTNAQDLQVASYKLKGNVEKEFDYVSSLLKKENVKKDVIVRNDGKYYYINILNIDSNKDKIVKLLKPRYKDLFVKNSHSKINTKTKASPTKQISNNNNNKNLEQKKYNLAIKYFENEQYQKAYELFDELFEKNLQDENINYYMGRSAYELKNYDEAINAYERVLITKPNNNKVKLERARTYFQTNMYQDAKIEFNNLLQDKSIPQNVKVNINKYLQIMEEKEKRNFFNALAIFTIGRDTNVNVGPDKEFINVTESLTIPNSSTPLYDTYHQELFVFSHTYDMYKKGGDFFKQDLILLNKTLFEYSDKNVVYLSYSPKYLNSTKYFNYDIGVNYDILWYGSERYLDQGGIKLNLNKIYNKKSMLNLGFSIQDKNFKQSSDKDKDSKLYETSLGYKYLLSDNNIINAKYLYQFEKSEDKNKAQKLDVDKDVNALSFDISQKFYEKYNLKYSFLYKNIDYKYANSYGNEREDDIYNHGLSLSRVLTKKSLIDLKYNYIKTDSNQDIYNTDKSIYSINYIVSF